jgi:hypothetical protein
MADYTRAHTIRELRACGWELISAAGDLERGEEAPLLDEVARRVQALAELDERRG